jgi:NAD(P)-dependent dehydrogenase (short-subunit alcohol dehydrogenase family)
MQGILIASYRVASLSALGMAALEPLDDGERGVVTLTASAAAQDAQVGQVAYGSGKAGVNGLVLPMARDLMDLGIRVNSIMPGIFATPPMMGIGAKVLDVLSASVPFPKRLGKPEEFASLVLELVRNSYFNAQTIRLDGGIRMPPR